MSQTFTSEAFQTAESEWVSFPGGELEGRRPRRRCPQCRDNRRDLAGERDSVAGAAQPARTLCFQCYRLELDRENALKAAAELNTASDARFQFTLPWEPVDRGRLFVLKAVRATERASAASGPARFADRRRLAQIAARHALQRAGEGFQSPTSDAAARLAALSHVAELQLPAAWLPFVVERSGRVGR